MSDDNDLSRSERMMAKAGKLLQDTQEARQESLGSQLSRMLDNLGRTENILAALAINLATVAVGAYIYVAVDGVVSFGGAILAILGVLAIVRWVVGL